jgi:hypothetical protein
VARRAYAGSLLPARHRRARRTISPERPARSPASPSPGDRLTIRLTRPVPDLLHRLALPFFCVLPKGRRSSLAASAARSDRRSLLRRVGACRVDPHQIVLRRNPNYRGDRHVFPTRIVYSIGPTASKPQAPSRPAPPTTRTARWSRRRMRAAARRRRTGPPAARAGRQRIFRGRTTFQCYLQLEHRRPLFRDLARATRLAHAARSATLLRAASPAPRRGPNDQFLLPAHRASATRGSTRLDGPDSRGLARRRMCAPSRAVLWLCPRTRGPYDQPQDRRDVATGAACRGIGLELVVEKLDDLESRIAAPERHGSVSLWGVGGRTSRKPRPTRSSHLFETGYPAADGVHAPLRFASLARPAHDGDLRARGEASPGARAWTPTARLDRTAEPRTGRP